MALTRKFLLDLGLDEAAVDSIIAEHANTTNNLINEIQAAKESGETLAKAQNELETLKGYKDKYEAEKAAHDKLKADIESEATALAKATALRAYFESKGISGENLNIALRGVTTDDIELDGEQIKDTTALDALMAGDYKPLISADNGNGSKSSRLIDSGAKIGVNDHGGGNKVLSIRQALREEYNVD